MVMQSLFLYQAQRLFFNFIHTTESCVRQVSLLKTLEYYIGNAL